MEVCIEPVNHINPRSIVNPFKYDVLIGPHCALFLAHAQVRVRADRARSRLLKEKKERNLVRAYGRAA